MYEGERPVTPSRKNDRGCTGLRRPIHGHRAAFGFTVTELLIVLLIVGEIATFTIPKVLSATQANTRYVEAQESLATVANLTYSYAQQNGGCFPGNLTCRFNKTTGAAQDGLATTSTNGQTSFDQFEAYLDSHLNYVEKGTCGTLPCWTLANGTTYIFYELRSNGKFRPTTYELSARWYIYLDTTIAQINAGQYSYYGVDTDLANLFAYANGGMYGGYNNFTVATGVGYFSNKASIFDLKDHPSDTCAAVGGYNCGL